MLRLFVPFVVCFSLAAGAQDASSQPKATQSDMLVGTRVPRGTEWTTPTPKLRWQVWWRGVAASPGAYLRSGIASGMGQWGNSPRAYGQGWDAYGKRFGNSFLSYTLQDSASQGLAAAAGYEVRYIQCKCTKFLPRIGHALAYTFVTYNRNGKRVLNWPSLAGTYSAGMLSSSYTTGEKWSAGGIRTANSGIYFGFASSLLQEFTPSSLFKRKAKKQPAGATTTTGL